MGKSQEVQVTPVRQDTLLSVSLHPGSGLPWNQLVTGKLTTIDGSPVEGKTIYLWIHRSFDPVFRRYGTVTTYPDGSYLFAGVSVEEGIYRFKAAFDGDYTHNESVAYINAEFMKNPSDLSIYVDPIEGLLPLTVTITGKLRDAATGIPLGARTVNLYQTTDTTPTLLASTKTSNPGPEVEGGDYTFQLTLTQPGTYTFFTEFPGDAQYIGCMIHDGAIPFTPDGDGDGQPNYLPLLAGLAVVGGIIFAMSRRS